MKQLWITLPAFAPDYSGVCSAMFELGGLSVIHDASGCTGNYTGYDEPRWYGSQSKVFCSGLREIDAVLGRDDKLTDQIIQACDDLNPTLVTVLGSPVPMLIGTDMHGIAREIETRSGLPSFGFNTNGLHPYNKGISEAITALIDRFAGEPTKIQPRGINLLGMTPLDFSIHSNVQDFVVLLEAHDFTVMGRLMMGVDLEQISHVADAAVNLVVAESGLAAAKDLHSRYGTPYVVGTPVGDGCAVCQALEQALADRQCHAICDAAQEGEILLIGEQVIMNSLRRAILQRSPGTCVTVGTMFGLNRGIAAQGDLDIPDEEFLRHVIRSRRFSKLAADPLFEELITPQDQLAFYPLAHPAVSSKLYWDQSPVWLGEEMQEWIEKIIFESWRL